MLRRFQKHDINKQIHALLEETDNPAIIQDVIDTEFGVIPEDISDFQTNHHTSAVGKYFVNNFLNKHW